jgi:hypothetical protein
VIELTEIHGWTQHHHFSLAFHIESAPFIDFFAPPNHDKTPG